MILIDANLLVYAHDSRSPHHQAARSWLESVLSGSEPVRIPLVALLAFVRVVTNPSLFPAPLSPGAAIDIVEGWLAQPNVAIATPTERHWHLFREAASGGQARGPMLMDAHIAALAIEHGATLMSADRGFARFPGLRFRNPIAA
jgi:toxin-antitoxin system PIN domain toxin